MSENGTMRIVHDERDGVDIIRLEGEIDLMNAALVREAVDATTAAAVVLDLTEVAFLDSMALSTLDGSHRRLASDDRSLFVVAPPQTPSAWTLRVAGLDTTVVQESLDSALVSAIAQYRRQ
jgi:anti-anti-sigma factor